jgi:hypothetical protein
MAAFLYEFEWDPVKAQANARKLTDGDRIVNIDEPVYKLTPR